MARNAAYRKRIAQAKARLDAELAAMAQRLAARPTPEEFQALVRGRLNVAISPDYAAELLRLNGGLA